MFTPAKPMMSCHFGVALGIVATSVVALSPLGCTADEGGRAAAESDPSGAVPEGAEPMPGAAGVGEPNVTGMGSEAAPASSGSTEGAPQVGLAPVATMNQEGSCPAGGASCEPRCVAGLSVCEGSCVDTSGSPEHCGGCGQACPDGQSCWLGSCRCPTGQAACEGSCGDVLANLQHCGSCGNVCPAGADCIGGTCTCPDNGLDCNGTCRTVLTDPGNCGTCGTTCGAGTECLFGGCVDPDSVDCGGADAQNERTCVRDATLELGRYWINNNQWGIDDTVTGQQCIWSSCRTGDLVGWGTDWNWQGGSNFQVKSFVSLVHGWNWGNRIENTGLPVQIGNTSALNCGWNFTVAHTGTLSVTFDLFLHTVPNPDYQTDPTDEVMIWPYRGGGAGPLGTQQATVNLAGTTWDLYRGTHPVWANVFSFVRTQNTTTAVINVMDFMRDLVNRGLVEPEKYISTIQTGTEIFTGSGSLTTHGFFCRVQ